MRDRLRNPTIIDVAERAGVSKSVVSRVLTGHGSVGADNRERVLASAAELGYVVNAVARAMVARRTHTLGVFVRDASTPFYGYLLTAMQEQAAERGYRVVTATGSGRFAVADEQRALETLVQLRMEGLVVCSGLLPVSAVVPLAQRLPLVVAGRPETHEAVSSVFCDEEGGGAGLADYVADLGHRVVCVLRLSAAQSLSAAPRVSAMARRLRERGVRVVELDGGPVEGLDDIVRSVLAQPEITALMTPSDQQAMGVLEALQRRGLRAPDHLSVTGYDGIGPLSTPVLGLTSWIQPVELIGTRAVDAVVAQLDGAEAPQHHLALPGVLAPGMTAARPPRA